MNSKAPIDGRRTGRNTPQLNLQQGSTEAMLEQQTREHMGEMYARVGRQHRGNGNVEEETVGNLMAEQNGGEMERNMKGEHESGRQTYIGSVEEGTSSGNLRRDEANFSSSLRRDAALVSLRHEGIQTGSLGRDERTVLTGGSPQREQAKLMVGSLGRAGSELNMAFHGSPHVEANMKRAGSLNTVRGTPRGSALRSVYGAAGSDPHLARAVSSRHTELVEDYMERVAADNYCSSCGEEEDLNESLLTTTTTNSSDQTATCSSGSNSIAQECWENDIQSDGSLLYISCYYNEKTSEDTYDGNEILSRLQRQQSESHLAAEVPVSSILKPIETNRSENRIIKLIRKKSLKSSLAGSAAKVKKLNIEIPSATVKKLKSNFVPYDEPREVSFQPGQNLNLGRRATLSEIKLGLQLDESGDKLRVVGIIPDSNIYHSKLVQVNDLLLSVNDRPVSKMNINEVLSTVLHNHSQVRLKLQGTKSKHELARERHNYKSKLVTELLYGVDSAGTDMCLVYVNANGLQYKYPADKNNLSNSFGLFLTLNNMFNNAPRYSGTSSVECDAHVVFTRDKQFKNSPVNNLLLICFPHHLFHSYELCLKWNKMIVRCLRFEYGYELEHVFDSSHFASLNRLFSFLFDRILTTQGELSGQSSVRSEGQSERVSNEEYIKICKTESYTPLGPDGGNFFTAGAVSEEGHMQAGTSTIPTGNEQLYPRAAYGENSRNSEAGALNSEPFTFGYPRKLKLSMELEAQINEALGELEANDTYEDDVKNFIVLGTCLYYRQYLLTAHMHEKDLLCVQSSLFCKGLLQVNSQEKNIKNVILWKQVFPKSHTVENLYYNNNLKAVNVYYALVYGRGNFLLCTLLESNYFTNPNTNSPGVHPDVKLIRHVEETVNFLISTRNYSYLNKEIGLLRLRPGEARPLEHSGENVSLSGSYQSHSTLTDEDCGGGADYLKQGEVSTLLPLRLVANSAVFYYVHVNKGESVQLTPDLCKVSNMITSPHEAAIFSKFQKCVYKIEKVFNNYAKFRKLNSGLHSKPVKLNRSTISVKEFGICFTIGENKFWTVGRLYNNVNQVFLCYASDQEGVLSQNMIEIVFKLCASYS